MAPDRLQTQANVATDRFRRECQQEKFAARASDRKTVVLELDEARETLCVWYWYVSRLKYMNIEDLTLVWTQAS
jgi:hypothetical protein